jgi:hypothetical protein
MRTGAAAAPRSLPTPAAKADVRSDDTSPADTDAVDEATPTDASADDTSPVNDEPAAGESGGGADDLTAFDGLLDDLDLSEFDV